MNLPFKPHVLALICSAGLLAASGVLYMKSREPQAPVAPQPVAAQTPAPVATPAPTAPEVKADFTPAQITQWVAPIALYPDSLLSQVLMASTYPANVVQAVQWSHDNPTQKGDAAIQAVAGQPWDPSVKSLVAFPQLMAMMGENPEWVQNLGDAFLAQPQDVMDAVQRLRQLAQQTGTLKSGAEQKVIVTTAPKKTVAPTTQNVTVSSPSTPPATIIKIEPTNPEVVYVPNYNPSVVYGSWPNTAYPPTYLPPPQGEPFVDSFVKGFGYSMGVATTYALFSSIDWDDDDHHHDDDDYHHHDDGPHGYQHNGDNININVNNYNHISGQNLPGQHMSWQHNPAFRGGVPYHNGETAQRFHQTNVSGGLSATPLPATSRDTQRQAAMTQLQQRTHASPETLAHAPAATSRDAERKSASRQLNQIAQRNNYRGYDTPRSSVQRENSQHVQRHEGQPSSRLSQQQRDSARERINTSTPQQRQQFRQNAQANHTNVFSGNDIRSPSWQSQQQRGLQSRHVGNLSSEQRSAGRERLSEHHEFHRR